MPVRITTRLLGDSRSADEQLLMPFEQRQKRRFRARMGNGEEAGVILDRGGPLRGGDQLLAEDGRVIEIVAAEEPVSTVRAADPRQLARAGYHLGNRHVSLQIGSGWLRYLQDHVLDEMVRGLGLEVTAEMAPFEPEAGAYGSSAHQHNDYVHV